MKYIIANFLLALLPPTRWFEVKRILLHLLGVRVGKSTRICGDVKFFGSGKVTIGRDCWIGIGTRFYTADHGDVFIGNQCDIAPEVSFHCGSHYLATRERRAGRGRSRSIVVGRGSWIGVRSTILRGSRIGRGSVLGAGTLVLEGRKGADSLVLGTPARIIRRLP